MIDFYGGRLKYVTIVDTAVEGDPEQLAQAVEQWDEDSDPDSCDTAPTFEGGDTGAPLMVTLDASELFDYEGEATWTLRVDLSSALDWDHPWQDSTITAAEAVYHEHRDPTDPRWTLRHIEGDALRFLRQCVGDGWASTPKDADKLLSLFLDYLRDEAEDTDPDPIAALVSEAMEDAKPTSTGIPQLDALLGGGLHRGLSVLAGDPGSGKSALAIQAALFAANQSDGLVAYGMADQGGAKSALLRMISCAAAVAGVDGCELSRAGEWDAREVYQGRQAFDRVSKGRIELTDQIEISELISWLDLLNRTKGHVSFVAIDFAQACSYDGRPLAFDAEAASQAVRKLREWAHAHNAVVLMLSAFSKSASEAHSKGAAPSMSDILGSAELSYSAEHVLALSNRHDGSGEVTARDLKARHAGNVAQSDRACTLKLDGFHGLFA